MNQRTVSRGHTDSLLTKPRRQCIAVTVFASGAGQYHAAEIAQAQSDAAQQINQALTNAQTQDQQLNQQALDQTPLCLGSNCISALSRLQIRVGWPETGHRHSGSYANGEL